MVLDAPVAERLPLVAVASTEPPQPVKFTTRTSNDRLEATPAPSPPRVQLCPEPVAEHDQDDDPTRPSNVRPVGKVMFAVTGPVAAEPGSDTLTVTKAVTPRLSTPFTCTDTPSLALAETVVVGVGDALGDALGDAECDVLGLPVGVVGVVGGLGVGECDDDPVGFGAADWLADGVVDAPGRADDGADLSGWPVGDGPAAPARRVIPGPAMAPTWPRCGCRK